MQVRNKKKMWSNNNISKYSSNKKMWQGVSHKVFIKAPFNSHNWVTMLDFIQVCLTYSWTLIVYASDEYF